MVVADVYRFYSDYVKPVYSEIEARDNCLPIELLFETHSAFDHLKRHYIDDQDENHASQKALAHLQRDVLDAFKLKLKFFNDDYGRLFNRRIDFTLIDNGRYLASLLEDRRRIVATAKKARLSESSRDKAEAFDLWMDVSIQINEWYEKYYDESKLKWAKRKTFIFWGRDFIIGVITGIISSCIFAGIVRLIKN